MTDTYLKKLLGEGESVLFVDRQHWLVLLRNIFIEGVAIVAVLVLTIYLQTNLNYLPWHNWFYLLLLLLIWPVISLLFDFLQWYNRKYIVTNWRVIQLSGVINKDVIDSSLEKVNDIELTQSFFGRILHFGNVEILTASEIGVNKFMTIREPVHFKTVIVNAKEQLGHDEDHPAYAQAAPVIKAAPAPADIPSMIERLDDLRKRGVLTEEEFQRSKEQLLQKLSEQDNTKQQM